MLIINPDHETQKIVSFLKETFAKQEISHAVIGISGGIDSATSLFLLKLAIPLRNIHAIHLPYSTEAISTAKILIESSGLPKENVHILSIKPTVDKTTGELQIANEDTVRRGNIMARTRMIYLFDFAKKLNAMVVGTENKSEHYLGYFTRFGDAASDIEPILHLYKTQIRQLAKQLGVPQEIIDAQPTAGLWEGQTDEAELGFTYQEADEVLRLYFDTHKPFEEIRKAFPNADKVITHVKKNEFKFTTPYSII